VKLEYDKKTSDQSYVMCNRMVWTWIDVKRMNRCKLVNEWNGIPYLYEDVRIYASWAKTDVWLLKSQTAELETNMIMWIWPVNYEWPWW
jgi:hypothetical protein